MQAVILAGGKGTRLKPLTNQHPKPMIPIHDKPFLEYQLELIKSFGLTQVLLLAGYLGKQIEEYFGNGSKFGFCIKYSYEKELLGTGGALKNAENMLEREFLLLNGDTYLPINYRELIKYYYVYNKIGTITVYDNSDKIASNNLAVGKSNLVLNYNKNNSEGMTHVDAGVMVFKKEILEFIPKDEGCSLENEVFHRLIKKEQLLAFPTNQRFYDMGSFMQLEVIKEILP